MATSGNTAFRVAEEEEEEVDPEGGMGIWFSTQLQQSLYVCVTEGLAIAGGIGLLTFAVLSTAAAAAVMAVVVVAAWMDGWMDGWMDEE